VEAVPSGSWGTMCRFPCKSLLVGLGMFLGDCEVQAEGQSWGNLCGADELGQKSEFGAQRVKTWVAASAPFPSA